MSIVEAINSFPPTKFFYEQGVKIGEKIKEGIEDQKDNNLLIKAGNNMQLNTSKNMGGVVGGISGVAIGAALGSKFGSIGKVTGVLIGGAVGIAAGRDVGGDIKGASQYANKNEGVSFGSALLKNLAKLNGQEVTGNTKVKEAQMGD